jgi:aspartyl-tRNA(Asn)/glutamyl-tRNA(Gln) amidotransferase subunit C
MQITTQELHKLAKLAQIEISLQEEVQLLQHMHAMFAMVERLQEVDTTGVEPLTHLVEETQQRFRSDELQPTLTNQEVVEQAPISDGTFFQVPKVIRK